MANARNAVEPSAVQSRRLGKKLSTHELARFLNLLSETGNFALACDRLGRAKSGLYKRRARDAAFNAQCKAALRRFRMNLASLEREGRGAGRTIPSGTILSRYGGRSQLRRVKTGTLTRAGRKAFLETLALTSNIRFAALSTGVQPSSIHYRRRTDPAFAAEMREALAMAADVLKLRLIEAAAAFFDPSSQAPFPLAGEGGGDGANEDSDPFEPVITHMTVSQAIRLVEKLDKELERETRRAAEAIEQRPPDARADDNWPERALPPAPAEEAEKPRRAEPRVRRL